MTMLTHKLPTLVVALVASSSLLSLSIHGFSIGNRNVVNKLHNFGSTIDHNSRLERPVLHAESSAASTTPTSSTIEENVNQLKKVLEREYVSFFDPMEREYYSPKVTFDDPMTSLAGVDSYQNNVDMLASRTLLGKILFDDAGIVLHSVTGGEVNPTDNSISNIITRWTLRVTAKILPWSPTARFSGISVYEVKAGGPKGVMVTHQTDYWDSINIKEGGTGSYQTVDKNIAVQDFLNQLKPNNFAAPAAGLEVPHQLLRRGNGYEVRKYPSYTATQIQYTRRDEGYDALSSITKGLSPLAPAILEVASSGDKFMTWPLEYALPGQATPPPPIQVEQKLNEQSQWTKSWNAKVMTIPSRVVAVGRFKDASVEPVVRKADRELRECCKRDGLVVSSKTEGVVKFAQYDAIFSMGERRGEVWIELEDGGHPW